MTLLKTMEDASERVHPLLFICLCIPSVVLLLYGLFKFFSIKRGEKGKKYYLRGRYAYFRLLERKSDDA